MKVGIIGAGAVGSSAAFAMVMSGVASEIVLVDLNEKLAHAQAEDILHATPFSNPARVISGGYELLKEAQVVILSCGVAQKPGESRLQLLERNAVVFQAVIKQVLQHVADPILVVASNPVDIMTEVTHRLAKLAPERVFGTGTILDTARFRTLLAQYLEVSPQSVHAYVLGEHGDSEVLIWSSVSVGGMPLEEFAKQRGKYFSSAFRQKIDEDVRRAAYRIIDGKGATNYGIGAGIAHLVRMIRDNTDAVLTLSVPAHGEKDKAGVCFSLPCILGSRGVCGTLEPNLAPDERKAIDKSAALLEQAAGELRI